MPVIQLIVVIALVGFLLWAISTYVPMPPMVHRILMVVAIFALILWLLQVFGLLEGVRSMRVGALVLLTG